MAPDVNPYKLVRSKYEIKQNEHSRDKETTYKSAFNWCHLYFKTDQSIIEEIQKTYKMKDNSQTLRCGNISKGAVRSAIWLFAVSKHGGTRCKRVTQTRFWIYRIEQQLQDTQSLRSDAGFLKAILTHHHGHYAITPNLKDKHSNTQINSCSTNQKIGIGMNPMRNTLFSKNANSSINTKELRKNNPEQNYEQLNTDQTKWLKVKKTNTLRGNRPYCRPQ